eukprot:TRINITY_DN202_c0_g2_i1.p1 TRINITY_DN202_c0_g2~~TRINITY_DN202_c0_g2_i1.p1  ORF type:complete len:300 (+),score=50.77 TRINITY_DN202_c0_g2_i1:192-1091(+)
MEAISEILKTDTKLTTLELMNNKIGDIGIKYLVNALKTNSKLTEIDLLENQITDDGIEIFASLLKDNQTLTKLNLGRNEITCVGATTIANEVLLNNTALKDLDISGGHDFLRCNYTDIIRDEGATAIAKAMEKNTSLQILSLARNLYGDRTLLAFTQTLNNANMTLTDLDLCGGFDWEGLPIGEWPRPPQKGPVEFMYTPRPDDRCFITDEAVIEFCKVLKTNSTLQCLNLGCQKITFWGGQELAEALEVNSTLTKLQLFNNNIGDRGAFYFYEMLIKNSTITYLNLYENDISYYKRSH